MTTVRCYLPLSAEQVETLRTDRLLPGPGLAFAVTAAVRSAEPDGDDDSWEYAVAQACAAHLLERSAPVVIAAADLERGVVSPGHSDSDHAGALTVADVPLPRVAAFHLGDDVVSGDREALAGASGPIDLSWYDTTEIAHVCELLAQGRADDGAADDDGDGTGQGKLDDG